MLSYNGKDIDSETNYRTLLDADVREFEQFMEDGYRDMQWEIDHPKLFAIRDKYFELKDKLLEHTLCKWFGCDIQMSGYADGDTGWEDWQCNRCGRGGRHIYY